MTTYILADELRIEHKKASRESGNRPDGKSTYLLVYREFDMRADCLRVRKTRTFREVDQIHAINSLLDYYRDEEIRVGMIENIEKLADPS